MTIGFSCGVFHKLQNNNNELFSRDVMQRFVNADAVAIELMCHTKEHLAFLCQMEHEHIAQFAHISVHAPAYAYADDDRSHILLEQLAHVSKLYGLAYVVFHPDAVIDWDVVSRYDIPVAIENMDDRKASFRTVKDVKELLDRYAFGLVIDLQHCYVNDPTMQLARELHKQCGDRLMGYHISGYDEKLLHVPLFGTRQDEIIRAAEQIDLPLIIESAFVQYDEEKEEMRYISKRLSE